MAIRINVHRLGLVFDGRGLPIPESHRKLLRGVSVLHFIGLCLNGHYLPTLARYPADSLLPVRGDLDGVFLQPFAVGTYKHTEAGELHGRIKPGGMSARR